MKSRRLTETDIANLAFKSRDAKYTRLLSLERPKAIIGSYEPFRRSNGDAVNLQLPLIAEPQAPSSLAALEAVVAKACKGDPDLLAMNLPIARATHDYASVKGIVAIPEEVRALVLPFGHKYQFGMPLLMAYPDGRVVAVFPDLRRSDALTAVGRRSVFSLMHHRWRENNPDLRGLGLEIWRYRNTSSRQVEVIECVEAELFSYEQIIADVRETYEIWHQVLQEAAFGRRANIAGPGPLFGAA